jgi:hypothetical protein
MTVTALAIALGLALPAAAQQPDAVQQTGTAPRAGEVRHSGRVVEVGQDGRRLVLEEMVAWRGPGQPGIIHRSITLTPRTAIQLVERTGEWGEARTSMPGWSSKNIESQELRTGDFVTVTTDDDARSRAVSLEVIRPGS